MGFALDSNVPNVFYRPKRQVLSIVFISTSVLVLAFALAMARQLVLVSLIGVGFGVLLSPLLTWMYHKRNIPRVVTAILFVIALFAGAIGVGYILYLLLSEQVSLLIAQAPDIAATIQREVGQYLETHPYLESQVRKLQFEQAVRTMFSTVFQGVQTVVIAVVGTLLVLSLSIYVALHSESYFQGLLSLFPKYERPRAAEVLHQSALVLRQWFTGQLIVISISGAAATLGLWLLEIDYWLLLGVLTGILGFIPYIGPIITMLVAAIVTLGSDPNQVGWVLALYLAIQQLQGDVTIPLVMKGRVRLPEAHLIVFMFLMGGVFGVLGVFIAPPLFAVLRNVYLMTYVTNMNQKTHPPEKIRKSA